jgi:hypothetical protein
MRARRAGLPDIARRNEWGQMPEEGNLEIREEVMSHYESREDLGGR